MVQCTWLWCAKLLYFYRFFNILTIYSDKLHREEGTGQRAIVKIYILFSELWCNWFRSLRNHSFDLLEFEMWKLKSQRSFFRQFCNLSALWAFGRCTCWWRGNCQLVGHSFELESLPLCIYSDWICVLDGLLCVTPYHVRGICVCLCVCGSVYCVWWWNARVTSGIYGWAWVFWLGAFRVCSRCILMILYCSGCALWQWNFWWMFQFNIRIFFLFQFGNCFFF